jgi:hypothetical protein
MAMCTAGGAIGIPQMVQKLTCPYQPTGPAGTALACRSRLAAPDRDTKVAAVRSMSLRGRCLEPARNG